MGSEGNVFTITEKRLEEMSERLLENSLKRLRKSSSETSSDEDNAIIELIKNMTADLKEVVQRVETQVKGIIENQSNQKKKLKEIDSKIEQQIQDTAKLREETNKEIANIKKSIEKETKSTKQKLNEGERKMNDLKKLFDKTESEKKIMKRKSIDQEARSRRNNLVFFGIPEKIDEKCDLSLSTFFKETLGISQPIAVQRAHRLGKPIGRDVIGKNANRPRPIIALLLDFQQREAVRTAARRELSSSSPYGVAEDYPIEIRKARKSVSAEVRDLKKQNKKVTILYPCRVLCEGQIVREVDVADFAESSE